MLCSPPRRFAYRSSYPLKLLRTIVRKAMPIISYTFVHNVNKIKALLDVTITASITLQFRDLYSIYCSYINILTGNINFQGKVYMDIYVIILYVVVLFDKYLRTTELSSPDDGHF